MLVHYSYDHMRKKSVAEQVIDKHAVMSLIEDGAKKQSIVEYTTMLEGLEKLDNWCKENKKTEFFTYFQDALVGAYYSYSYTKQKNWSKKRDRIALICRACLAAIPVVVVPVVISVATKLFAGELALADNKTMLIIGGVLAAVIAMMGLVMYIYNEKYKKSDYHETWVRHSLRNSRLQLAMNEFLVSERSETDYEKLVNNTFAILEQNLDQFAVNMCPKGVASRAKNDD